MASQLAPPGLTPSTYRGTNGLYGRADLAGLNLAQYPSILIELGNMKNQQEAAAMTTPEGGPNTPPRSSGDQRLPVRSASRHSTGQEMST